MAAVTKVNVKVLSEEKILFYGECQVLFVPYKKHETVAILAHHTPTIMKLGEGDVIVKTDEGKETLATIKTGILYVGENEASVLVDL